MAKETPPAGLKPASTGWPNIGAGALIFCATLLAYLPAIRGGFLWDDDEHVTKAALRSFEGLKRIWFELGATQQYYPLLHSAFWMEHRLWGDAVLGYHLTNILLHATAACLVVAVVRRLTCLFHAPDGRQPTPALRTTPLARGDSNEGSRKSPLERDARQGGGCDQRPPTGEPSALASPGALLAGLVFALHPVGVESVAWITEQKNTLSAVFYLGAALAYLRFDRDRRNSQYWLALGLFVLALLTKTVTATLPAALLVMFWWQRGRLGWKRDVLPLLPWFVLGVTGGLFTAWVERTFVGAQGTEFTLTGFERGLLAGRVIWFYLGKLLWPTNLIFIYPRWVVDATVWWQYLFPLGVVALGVGLGWMARRRRGPLAGFLFFAGTLFPALGFFDVYPFRYSYVADHFQYLASLGVIVPLAAGLTLAAGRIARAARWLAPAAGAMLLATLGALTWSQSGMYRDAGTLYRETLARNPASWMAHNNLGEILVNVPGRLPEALGHFEAALRINPKSAEAHNNLGLALAKMGRMAEAIGHFETALQINPHHGDAHNNLGIALAMTPGRLPEAIRHFEAAKQINPDDVYARFNLGKSLAQIPERLPEAIAEYEAALRLKPDYAAVHHNLGDILAGIPGRLPEAINHYEAALRLKPDHAEARFALGAALAGLPGRNQESLAHFEAVLKIKPDDEAARQWIERLRAGRP